MVRMMKIKSEEFKSLYKALKYYEIMSEKYDKVEYRTRVNTLNQLKDSVELIDGDFKADWEAVQEFRKIHRWVQDTSYINCIQL